MISRRKFLYRVLGAVATVVLAPIAKALCPTHWKIGIKGKEKLGFGVLDNKGLVNWNFNEVVNYDDVPRIFLNGEPLPNPPMFVGDTMRPAEPGWEHVVGMNEKEGWIEVMRYDKYGRIIRHEENGRTTYTRLYGIVSFVPAASKSSRSSIGKSTRL